MRRGIFKGKNKICNVFSNWAVVILRRLELAALAACNTKKRPVWWGTVGCFIVEGFRIQGDWKTFFAVIWEIKAVVESNIWHRVFLYKVVMRKYYSFLAQHTRITQFTVILTLFYFFCCRISRIQFCTPLFLPHVMVRSCTIFSLLHRRQPGFSLLLLHHITLHQLGLKNHFY